MHFLTRVFQVALYVLNDIRIFDGINVQRFFQNSKIYFLDPMGVSYFQPELFWLFSSMVFLVAADFFLSSKKHIINIRTVSFYSYCLLSTTYADIV